MILFNFTVYYGMLVFIRMEEDFESVDFYLTPDLADSTTDTKQTAIPYSTRFMTTTADFVVCVFVAVY